VSSVTLGHFAVMVSSWPARDPPAMRDQLTALAQPV